jgi:transcriptional regulator with XRE-family HTH domain
MDYLDSFGDWLRQLREALRLTRPELADCASERKSYLTTSGRNN